MPSVPYLADATAETPTFVDDSEWHPLIDGREYLTELDAALRGLGPGDSVQLVGLQLWLGLDLSDGAPAPTATSRWVRGWSPSPRPAYRCGSCSPAS